MGKNDDFRIYKYFVKENWFEEAYNSIVLGVSSYLMPYLLLFVESEANINNIVKGLRKV